MFVITADQVDSRHRADLAAATMERLTSVLGSGLVLPIDRTAGDEIQLLLDDPTLTLRGVLLLTRTGDWSVGCGTGEVSSPLPANTREAGGGAFIAARDAVNAAKKRETRFAIRAESALTTAASDIESLIDLLLQLRSRRSAEGWQIYDLIAAGNTQAAAAALLAITPQAASKRARTAAVRIESAAIPALERMLAAIDSGSGAGGDSAFIVRRPA